MGIFWLLQNIQTGRFTSALLFSSRILFSLPAQSQQRDDHRCPHHINRQ